MTTGRMKTLAAMALSVVSLLGSMPFSVETNNLISVRPGQTDELAGA